MPERKRGLFRKKRTLPSPKIFLTTSRLRAREASGGIQRKIFFFLFLLALGSFFYLLFFFPFWEIKKVNILGTQNIKEEEAEKIVQAVISGRQFFIFPKRNLILVSKKEVSKKIEDSFAQVEKVEVKKEFPDILKITILEKTPVAIWATGASQDLFLPPEAFITDTTSAEKIEEIGIAPSPLPSPNTLINYFFVNGDGVLGDQVAPDKIYEQNLPIIYDQSFKRVNPRENIVTREFLKFLFLVRDIIPLKTGLQIKEFIVPIPDSHDLYIKIDRGYQIFFDTQQSFQNQLNTLLAVLKEDINKNNKEVKYYIDLRVEGMVYYR